MITGLVEDLLVGGELPQVVGQAGDHRHGRQELLAAAGGQLLGHVQRVTVERKSGQHRIDVFLQFRFHLVGVAVDHRRTAAFLVQQLQQLFDAEENVVGHVGFASHPCSIEPVDLDMGKDRHLTFRFAILGGRRHAPMFREIRQSDHPFLFLSGPNL